MVRLATDFRELLFQSISKDSLLANLSLSPANSIDCERSFSGEELTIGGLLLCSVGIRGSANAN
jgi:hypothetical protein